jgi:hypothetical protein
VVSEAIMAGSSKGIGIICAKQLAAVFGSVLVATLWLQGRKADAVWRRPVAAAARIADPSVAPEGAGFLA